VQLIKIKKILNKLEKHSRIFFITDSIIMINAINGAEIIPVKKIYA